jgi:hypothetical protein
MKPCLAKHVGTIPFLQIGMILKSLSWDKDSLAGKYGTLMVANCRSPLEVGTNGFTTVTCVHHAWCMPHASSLSILFFLNMAGDLSFIKIEEREYNLELQEL